MMSLLLYLAVLLVSVSSVLFGLGWFAVPEPHYKPPPVQVASQATATPKADARLSPVDATMPAPPPADTAQPAVAAAPPPAVAQSAPAATPAPIAAAPPACDIQACTAAYRSFRAADCTYQPNNGPRRLCSKGTPPAKPAAAAAPAGGDAQTPAARAQVPSCNVTACTAAYRTFDPVDCTYQPSDGPRRLCSK